MAKPLIHARSSAKRYGGIPEDYLEVHDFMDSSKEVFPDNRHRALTHNSWFIFVVERVFGHTIPTTCRDCEGDGDSRLSPCRACRNCNGSGKRGYAHTRDIAEQHILEDFGGKYIPTPQDYLEHMTFLPWMNNGVEGAPSSHQKINSGQRTRRKVMDFLD